MTLHELRLARLNARRRLRDAADAIDRPSPTDDLAALRRDFDDAEAELRAISDRLDLAEIEGVDPDDQETRSRHERDARDRDGRAAAAVDATLRGSVSITSEPSPYHRGGRHSFLGDLLALNDSADQDARDRLVRNNRHVADVRSLTTSGVGSGAEFIVPELFLGQDYAPYIDAGRPFANAIGSRPLDPGINEIRIPKVTAGVTADMQTEARPYATNDITTDEATGKVEAIGHYADVSRQSIERSAPGVDEIILSDQLRALNLREDMQLLNGSGTSPQVLGALNLRRPNTSPYTDADPTQAEWIAAFGKAVRVHVGALSNATLAVLHPRRWSWLLEAVDRDGRPLIGATNSVNAPGQALTSGSYAGPVGTLAGVPVVVDGNLPTNGGTGTNQDQALIAEHGELRLWEGPPRVQIERGVRAHEGMVRLVTYRDIVFIPGRRETAVTIMSGTGFTPPA